MERPPQPPPRRGTQPLTSSPTKRLSDAFVSSSGEISRATRPMQPPPAALRTLVPQRLDQIRKELAYVRHLTLLFEEPVLQLRYALHLIAPPEPEPMPEPVVEPEPAVEDLLPIATEEALPEAPVITDLAMDDLTGWSENAREAMPIAPEPSEPPPAPDPLAHVPPLFQRLNASKRALSEQIAELLTKDDKLGQRLQVTLFQFDETVRSLEEASERLDSVYKSSYEEAWTMIPEVGIERLKGKAYAICGFYEHYKNDALLNRVFPPPQVNPRGQGAKTGPLVQPAGPPRPPAVQPAIQPLDPGGSSGLIGMLKGLFGK